MSGTFQNLKPKSIAFQTFVLSGYVVLSRKMFSRLDEAVTGFSDDCKQPDLGRSSKSIYYELIWDCLITPP